MIAKLGTEATLRPNRSIRNPAGTNIETSAIAEMERINPIWAASSPNRSWA